jgi:hypothetical protein
MLRLTGDGGAPPLRRTSWHDAAHAAYDAHGEDEAVAVDAPSVDTTTSKLVDGNTTRKAPPPTPTAKAKRARRTMRRDDEGDAGVARAAPDAHGEDEALARTRSDYEHDDALGRRRPRRPRRRRGARGRRGQTT